MNPLKRIQRIVLRFLLVIVLAALALYGGDYGFLRYRMARGGDALGSVRVQRYYAVPRKDGRTEFLFDQPGDEPCVRSLFPHFGDAPCWYLTKHPQKRIDI